MARLAGYGGQCYIRFGFNAEAGIRAWQIDHVLDTPEVTDFGSSGHKQVIAALDGWSGSFEGPKDGTPIDLGTINGVKFDEESAAGPTPSATRKWTGNIIITARHAKVAADGLVEYSYDFVGNGALTAVPTT